MRVHVLSVEKCGLALGPSTAQTLAAGTDGVQHIRIRMYMSTQLHIHGRTHRKLHLAAKPNYMLLQRKSDSEFFSVTVR